MADVTPIEEFRGVELHDVDLSSPQQQPESPSENSEASKYYWETSDPAAVPMTKKIGQLAFWTGEKAFYGIRVIFIWYTLSC